MIGLLPWAWLCTLPGLLLTALGRGQRPGLASLPGPLAIGLAGVAFLLGDHQPVLHRTAEWLPLVPDGAFSLRLDGLAAVMLCVVGFVSLCVYVYSLSYMRADPGQRRFFCLLDFFVAAMTLLVLAGNIAVLLAGWAGVGLASFLLIAFWRDREGTLGAGLQALAANAIGDAALLLACVLVPAGQGDLTTLAQIGPALLPGGFGPLAWLIVIAASAKSAQGLLYFWLPSAMAGPTPVSALIHAATMVAAGVYLLVRTAAVLALAPEVLHAVAWIGVVTAAFSALASLSQPNYKRGLAYSTCSQLGYMFAAVGFGAPFAALFHLLTHASFKALLFLCAGAVIHAAHGEEQLAKLGGLRRQLPQVMWLALIGSLALVGLPVLTAGAFSKDLILEAALHHDPALGWLLIGSVFLTGLYAGRLFFGVFGAGSSVPHREVHPPDALLLLPLWPLAAGAILLGWVGTPLAALLGTPQVVPVVSNLGLLASGLGIAGFVAAGLWQRARAGAARLPQFGVPWLGPVTGIGRSLASGFAGLHSGRLGLYVFTAVIGTAAILLFAVARAP
ncbi:MAG TPA: proton-conducting transporter membrane subunit [Planctomycetota bacterium]|nr:proton-conducting transporter membrane subunit [Planctomycetota bacterium]